MFLQDGDLMFNIATSPIKSKNFQNSNQNSNLKSNKKKEKYSIKMRQQRRKNNQSLNKDNDRSLSLFKPKKGAIDSTIDLQKNQRNDKIQKDIYSKTQNKQDNKNFSNRYQSKPKQFKDQQNKKSRNKFDKKDSSSNKNQKTKRLKQRVINMQRKRDDVIGQITLPKNIKLPQQLKQPSSKQISEMNKLDINPLIQFQLDPLLQNSLERNNVLKMTQIQKMSYQSLFEKQDCVIKANTGSGKTLAYLIPLINNIIKNKKIQKREQGTVILVVCPNRQLCIQAQKQAMRCLKKTPFIVPGCLVGGQQINHQKSRIRKGLGILFATPGRLAYHLKNTKSFKIDNLMSLIFEEADRTLDMGFQPTVKEIIQIISDKIPLSHLHKALVSAHFNEKVNSLIQNLEMEQPTYIGFNNNKNSNKIQQQKENQVKDQKQINISDKVRQKFVLISQQQRIPLLVSYLGLLKNHKILIFVSTIDQVVYLDMLFNNLYYRNSNGQRTQQKVQKRPIFKLHGDLDQKLRSQTYFNFRKEKQAILISTQVASRGLDFPDLSHIILFDPPPTMTDYGNRVGRSGRFNSVGDSLMILHYQQSDLVQKIKYYSPNIENLNRQVIFNGYNDILRQMKIGQNALAYFEGLVRGLVKDDEEKYQVARKAYTSMLRAYARLPDKDIFVVKKLNLKLIARTFGLNSVKSRRKQDIVASKGKGKNNKKDSNSKSASKAAQLSRQTNFGTLRKKRKVQKVQHMQVYQYL